MFNTHFKLNRSQTELLFPLPPNLVPPANFCLDTKPCAQVWLTYTTHPSWQILLSISSKCIQNPITSHHLYQICHLSPRLLYQYGIVSKRSQNNPSKTYVRSCPTFSKSSNNFPINTHPSFWFIHARYSWASGLFPSSCHDLPLLPHTSLPSSSLCSGHLLSEGFAWPLYLNLPYTQTLPLIPSSVFLHNITPIQYILYLFVSIYLQDINSTRTGEFFCFANWIPKT